MVGGLVMVSYHLVASLAYPTKITRDVVQRFVLAACAYILNKKRYPVFANSDRANPQN
jgi:hypothetical protein